MKLIDYKNNPTDAIGKLFNTKDEIILITNTGTLTDSFSAVSLTILSLKEFFVESFFEDEYEEVSYDEALNILDEKLKLALNVDKCFKILEEKVKNPKYEGEIKSRILNRYFGVKENIKTYKVLCKISSNKDYPKRLKENKKAERRINKRLYHMFDKNQELLDSFNTFFNNFTIYTPVTYKIIVHHAEIAAANALYRKENFEKNCEKLKNIKPKTNADILLNKFLKDIENSKSKTTPTNYSRDTNDSLDYYIKMMRNEK